jgi:hypothetical protein
MFPIIPWLLTTKLGRQVAVGSAIAVLLGAAFLIVRHKLIERGKELGRAEQLETDNRAWGRDRAAYVESLNSASQRLQEASKAITQYESTLAGLRGQVTALDASRRASQELIANLPDAQLLSDIRSRLGAADSRLPTPDSPSLSPTELRACDSCLAELPLLTRENGALREIISALEGKSAAQQTALAVTETQRDVAVAYANRLEGRYVEAYNLAQRVRRRPLILKILTFGLLKDPKVALPAPVSLKTGN